MATCACCGKTILLAGERSGGDRYCNRRCAAKRGVVILPPLKRTALALSALFVFDLGFSGQGFLALAVSVLGVGLVSSAALWALIRGERALAANRAWRILIYLTLGVATVGALAFHAKTAEAGAARIIEACRSYKAKHGNFPERLQDLVPEFLPSIPPAKYTLQWGQYSYWSHAGSSHTLVYVAVPPFGRRVYHLESGTWSQAPD